MTEKTDEKKEKKKLTLSRPGTLELKKTVDAGQVRQSFSHGRSKSVAVEVRRKRTFAKTADGGMAEVKKGAEPIEVEETAAPEVVPEKPAATPSKPARTLTEEERAARARALSGAKQIETEVAETAAEEARRRTEREEEEQRKRVEEEERLKREAEEEARREEEETRKSAEEEAARTAAEQAAQLEARDAKSSEAETKARPAARPAEPAREEEEQRPSRGKKSGRGDRGRLTTRRGEPRRRAGKLTVSNALDDEERQRSLASVRRARERERRASAEARSDDGRKIVREVVVPEAITVQELANRMAERGASVIKQLMEMGVMATITQTIDQDTAELVVAEFGHTVKRVSEADVEIGLKSEPDDDDNMQPRPPVVTVMGHVDHGKTSLLDAIRKTSVVSGEAGGITQHIGAYQVKTDAGVLTFIDTPGHAAFSAMRARGANVTDIVILVVAADDGIMPQTVEAIVHAKAAEVPIIVAINKMDRPDADPTRVRNELLQHELVPEEMGGDILTVEVSAIEGTNLDKLVETVLLQAELLELGANPDRDAEGVVIESRLDRGRGAVATLLVQRGTLNVGDIVVAGGEWGKVRALNDDSGTQIKQAGPAMPVEVLGLNGVPDAGDEFAVVESEARAREVTEFRQRRDRDERAAVAGRGTLEQMFSAIESGESQELALVIKADVQGSAEAIQASAEKLVADNNEVSVRILHSAVGGINESDIQLAKASNALVVGFNVRANPQARALAESEGVDLRYYSIIYELIDDLRAMLTGLLAPEAREVFLGNAQILEVFNITKVGRVAGCRISEGIVKRGAKVRLLRDSVVIHEGTLSTLKRFKEDVREVREGYECGMSFENYNDIKPDDVIECFEIEEVAREL